MEKKTIEVELTVEDHEKFKEICEDEGLTVFEKLDDLVHSFLTEGETHQTKAS